MRSTMRLCAVMPGHPSATVPHAESIASAWDASLCRETHYVFVRQSPATGLQRSALMGFLFFSPPIRRIKYVLNHSKWWFSRFSCLLLSCSGTHVYLLAVVYLFISLPPHTTPTPSTSVFLWGLRRSFLGSAPYPRLPVSLHQWLFSWTSEGFSAISHTVTGFTAGHRGVQPGLVYSSMLRAHPFSFPDLLPAFMTVFLFQVLTHSLLRRFERTLQVCPVRARCL